MNQTLQQVLPVAISIAVIILIAVAQAYSKTIAAITATMPLTIPLALWIVYAAGGDDRQQAIADFTGSLFVGVAATLVFTLALWLAARAGLGLVAMLSVAYGAWVAVLLASWAVRAAL
jgi:hypothetical protein